MTAADHGERVPAAHGATPEAAGTVLPGPELKAALVARLTALADDELVLGHRQAGWTGHAPLLEEDIAMANVAQDEIGHAVAWYELRARLDGSDPDRLVYFRPAEEFRSALLVEAPRGDWAFSLLRQYLFDAYEAELLARLRQSAYAPVSEAAAKLEREELFHLRYSRAWVERLAHGTEESRARLEAALGVAWPLLPQLLAPLPGDAALAAAGVYPDPGELAAAVLERTSAYLRGLGLEPPAAAPWPEAGADPRAARSEHVGPMLQVMQSVARSDAEAEGW